MRLELNTVVLEPGTPEFALLLSAMQVAARDETPLVLEVREGYTVPVFVKGDRVRVNFDNGPGPATVEGADDEFVRVSYGPKGRYTTSLPRSSVSTERRDLVPAVLRVRNEQ